MSDPIEPPPDAPSAPGPDQLTADLPATQPPSDRGGRRIALAAMGFIATLALLFGLSSLLRPATGDQVAAASRLPSGSPSGSATGPATAAPSASASASGATASPSGGDASASSSRFPSPSAGPPSPTPSADPVLVGAGDIADCDLTGDSATAALLDRIPGTVFTAGDDAYPDGSVKAFKDCYAPTWGRQLARTRPAAGNHDWGTRDLAGYLGYFGAAAGPAGVSWYSYDLGAWHVIVLDSECSAAASCSPDSAQGRWLEADLAASKAVCTMAIWHVPRFSSGEHGNSTSVASFWNTLYAAGVDVVVNGHDHDYERFAPQDPNGKEDRARGIREFVVGTGGAALRTFPTTVANSELRLAVTHGVIRFVLHSAAYEWTFIPTSGDVGDAGKASCH